MMNKYSVAIFIGRFQPFHNGHAEVVRQALTFAENVLILCGSCNTPRTLKNPFAFEEREHMVRMAMGEHAEKIWFLPLDDYPYDDASWVLQVQNRVKQFLTEKAVDDADIALIGHEKDSSSYYLDLFPQWKRIEIKNIEGISATPIRNCYFRLEQSETWQEHLSAPVIQWLNGFRQTNDYAHLQAEQKLIEAEKKAWQVAPYPPIFVTTDAMVVHRNKILLVKRGQHPGKGLWALPGGFLEQNELLLESCVRELKEETGLDINTSVWKSFLRYQNFYENPGRSARGRIITHVFYFHLPDSLDILPVQGGDDAASAFWQDWQTLDPKKFHDDHFHIISDIRQKTGQC